MHMAEIAKSATDPDDGKFIFERCIDMCGTNTASDYGADFEADLLNIAIGFLDQSNFQKFEGALQKLEKGWRADKYKMVRYKAILHLYGESASNEYIYQNLEYGPLREIAYQNAIGQQNYDEAERLCLLGLSSGSISYQQVPQWKHKLYEVYELSHNIAKQIDTARNLLLEGDFNYYEKLKGLLHSQNKWDLEYAGLLKECAGKLPYPTYMYLLKMEGELDLLFMQMQKHPEQVFTYGQITAEKYPSETSEIFQRQIENGANGAADRKSYQNVCRRLALYAESGYADAVKGLIAEYKVRHRNRPAFVDELSKIERKI
jgi:hypothetical protein